MPTAANTAGSAQTDEGGRHCGQTSGGAPRGYVAADERQGEGSDTAAGRQRRSTPHTDGQGGRRFRRAAGRRERRLPPQMKSQDSCWDFCPTRMATGVSRRGGTTGRGSGGPPPRTARTALGERCCGRAARRRERRLQQLSPLNGHPRGAETSPWTSGRVGGAQPSSSQRRPRQVFATDKTTRGRQSGGRCHRQGCKTALGDIDIADRSVQTSVGDSVMNQTARGRRSGMTVGERRLAMKKRARSQGSGRSANWARTTP